MVHGAVRSLFQLLGALIAGLLIVLPLFAWRLSSGPIALDFLTPYIEEALTAKDGSFSVKLDTTVLALGSGQRMLEIRALDVRAFAGGEQPVATVPEMALSINGRALMAGVVAPNAVRLVRPRLRLVRDETGAFQWGIGAEGGDAGEVVARIKDALLGPPSADRPGRHLQMVAVEDADLTVEDLKQGATWHAPDVDVAFRRTPEGLAATGRVAVELGRELGTVELKVAYDRAGDALDGELKVDDIRPSALAGMGGAMAALSAVDLPLSGTVRASGKADGTLSSVSFDMAGGAGALSLTEPVAATYPITSAALRGRVGEGMRRLELTEFYVDLGGPTASLSAVVDGLGGHTVVKADGVVRDVPVDTLDRMWPKGLAENARGWVVPNLSRGIAKEARITLSAHSASGRFDDVAIDHLGGEIRPEGVTVDYLHPMPTARNVQAVCTFDAKSFRIALKGGEVFGLRLREGTIVFTGLADADQFADIELVVAGPASDALKLIDSEPLKYAAALGIEPAKVGGDAFTRVRFKFPLLKTLKLDDVTVKAHATIRGASIPKVMMGLDLTGGTLDLEVDAKGLDATGPVVLGTIPAELKWRENFSAKNVPFRSRYQLQVPHVTEAQRVELGLDGPPFVAPFLSGPVAGSVTAVFQDGGKGEVETRVDLRPARMELPGLGWAKQPGSPGTAEALVRLDKKKIASVPRFSVAAGDLTTRGTVAFSPDGSARRVEFHKLAYGRTDGEGSLSLRPGGAGLDIAFKGGSFDAQPVIASDKGEAAAEKRKKKRGEDELPPMSVAINVKSLWLSDQGRLANATATLQRNAEDWRNVTLKGAPAEGKAFTAVLQPAGAKRRSVVVTSNDAGAVMRAFDVYDNLVGGSLLVEGVIDDADEAQPLAGTLRVSDYHIRNAPTLARLLTVAALTGILDLLQGEGVSFSSLEAPFVFKDGLIEVTDARAYGPALGLTGRGQIDLDHERLALEGTVVPAYAINSVLGNIPVLGWLITGGEKGGGFIAFNYGMKGPTQEPDITVNPLSMLTPGFLRNLFNIFDDGTETDARKKAPPREMQNLEVPRN